jgi:hypothetical protein
MEIQTFPTKKDFESLPTLPNFSTEEVHFSKLNFVELEVTQPRVMDSQRLMLGEFPKNQSQRNQFSEGTRQRFNYRNHSNRIGGFGIVFEGKLGGRVYAVKVSNEEVKKANYDNFLNEIRNLQ